MPMRVLLVEDDANKRTHILQALRQIQECETECAQSYHGAIQLLRERKYDIVLLDMSLPTFDVTRHEDGGPPQPYAGRAILRQMVRRHLEGKVLVLTQFDRFGEGDDTVTLSALDEDLRKAFPSLYIGSIHYDEVTGSWMDELKRALESVAGQRRN